MGEPDVVEREAAWGERMVEVKVRFWTDQIADGEGKIRRKHAWAAGVVRVERNNVHGISPRKPLTFNSLSELPGVIEEALIQHGIRLHPSTRMKKYLSNRR